MERCMWSFNIKGEVIRCNLLTPAVGNQLARQSMVFISGYCYAPALKPMVLAPAAIAIC